MLRCFEHRADYQNEQQIVIAVNFGVEGMKMTNYDRSECKDIYSTG